MGPSSGCWDVETQRPACCSRAGSRRISASFLRRAAALPCSDFTGSKAHNIVLRDRAIQRGLKLNEYGLFDASGTAVAGADEEGIYAALGLAWVPPDLRENRGEIDAAVEGRLPRLIDRTDLRGDLHSHTTATDGKDDILTMARAARAAGLEYLAITDHSKALAMANGLDERRAIQNPRRGSACWPYLLLSFWRS